MRRVVTDVMILNGASASDSVMMSVISLGVILFRFCDNLSHRVLQRSLSVTFSFLFFISELHTRWFL